MRNATPGLTAQDSEQHQDAGRQEETDLLRTGYPLSDPHPGAVARAPPCCAPSPTSAGYPSSKGGWGSGRRSSLRRLACEPSRLGAGAKAPLKAAGQAEIFIFLAGWWQLRKQHRACGLGPPSLPAPRLSVHTSGRAVLISPNLLIPALEFTNICESREHSHRVETAPPSRRGSRCRTG